MSITWPAVIKYSGDDELLFIKDESMWLSEGLNHDVYHESDVFFDSNGVFFSVGFDTQNNKVVLKTLQTSIAIEKFEEWVKNHMAALDQCCSSKLTLASIKEGFFLLGKMSQ
jgi:hypothetical protein